MRTKKFNVRIRINITDERGDMPLLDLDGEMFMQYGGSFIIETGEGRVMSFPQSFSQNTSERLFGKRSTFWQRFKFVVTGKVLGA